MAQTRAAPRARARGVARRSGRVIAARTAEQRGIRDRLVATRDALAAARSDKQSTLAGIREDRAALAERSRPCEAESAALAATIRAARLQRLHRRAFRAG